MICFGIPGLRAHRWVTSEQRTRQSQQTPLILRPLAVETTSLPPFLPVVAFC